VEKCESRFEVGGLGGAVSPRPPSWANGHTELSAGVLGETALPKFSDMKFESVDVAEGGKVVR